MKGVYLLIFVILGSIGNLAAIGFHLYTVWIAYHYSSWIAAIFTMALPVVAEIYWMFRLWYETGEFINRYSVMFFIVAGLVLCSIILLSVRLTKETKRRA